MYFDDDEAPGETWGPSPFDYDDPDNWADYSDE